MKAATQREKFEKETLGTGAQFALRFCLSFREISCVIPGMLKVEQVEENATSSDLGPLKDEVINVMTVHSPTRESFLGPQ